MSAPLSGRHALVTGGGRGIGAAIARRLLADGARVSIAGRDTARLAATAADLAPLGPIDWVRIDVADPETIDTGLAAATGVSPIDIVVNNAGIARSAPFSRTDAALWAEVMAVDLTGAFLVTRGVLPGMLKAGFGRVVNIASIAGLTGIAYCTAYCAAKHGLIGLTRALALETAKSGVTVNAVCPGYTDTDLVAEAAQGISAKTGRDHDSALAGLIATNPQGRLITPDEVAGTVAWLCQPGSASITGQSIAVAGGALM
jgi:NAD(P)-dependent dehydrogenase (short-subunit alcohol dehydrogenase family)